MSVVAIESRCMKTIRTHLVDNSGFILSDHKKTLQIFPTTLVKLAKSTDSDFFCTKLVFQKVSIDCKYKSSQEINTILC